MYFSTHRFCFLILLTVTLSWSLSSIASSSTVIVEEALKAAGDTTPGHTLPCLDDMVAALDQPTPAMNAEMLRVRRGFFRILYDQLVFLINNY